MADSLGDFKVSIVRLMPAVVRIQMLEEQIQRLLQWLQPQRAAAAALTPADQQQLTRQLASLQTGLESERSVVPDRFKGTIQFGARGLGKLLIAQPRRPMEAEPSVGSPCLPPVLCCVCRVTRAVRSCTHRPLHSCLCWRRSAGR